MKRTVRLSLGMSFIMLALVLIAPHLAPPKLVLRFLPKDMDYYHDEHYRLIREHTIAEGCHDRTENIGFSDFQRNRI